jgi:hypothetical protein
VRRRRHLLRVAAAGMVIVGLGVIWLASMQLAQTDVYYYGYWVYDPVADYYYWFPADLVIVDTTWVDYVP